ncbi:hypothetical protein ACQP1G_45900 [Nocardia sp. CA-107356]|uniref:hypothetical protein n=1 Tax=Nocardia sp. CA-107356 TaxID=3239972 RepID=UPI003D8B2353
MSDGPEAGSSGSHERHREHHHQIRRRGRRAERGSLRNQQGTESATIAHIGVKLR